MWPRFRIKPGKSDFQIKPGKPVSESNKINALLLELRATFPIHLDDSIGSLPSTSKVYDAQGYALLRGVPAGGDQSNCFTYIVIGRQEGMCRVFAAESKVIRVEFAWGNRETGPFSDFVTLFQK